MLVEIYVRPNASNTAVGGAHDGALVVRVRQPPERGRATAAALEALAEALRVPRRSVSLVSGAASRRKLVDVEVAGGERALADAVQRLLAEGRPRNEH